MTTKDFNFKTEFNCIYTWTELWTVWRNSLYQQFCKLCYVYSQQIKVPEVEGATSWGPPPHPRLQHTCRRCRDRTCCGQSCCKGSSSRLRENGLSWPWFVEEAPPEPCGRPPPWGPWRTAWWQRRREGWFDPTTTSWRNLTKKQNRFVLQTFFSRAVYGWLLFQG